MGIPDAGIIGGLVAFSTIHGKDLIDKISGAAGVLFEPSRIVKVAKAEGEAAIIKARAESEVDIIRANTGVEITDIQRRGLERFVNEEGKKQANMESIIMQALPQLKDSSVPKNMEDDWVSNFFDKCRIISDTEMQSLWAKVLAGEANVQGTFSKRTVNFLASLDKKDAQLFTALCGFAWNLNDWMLLLIYDYHASIYNDQGINFASLTHLDSIGLIRFETGHDLSYVMYTSRFNIYNHGTSLSAKFIEGADNKIIGLKAMLTNTGQQLARICGSEPVDGFQDYVIENWKQQGLIIT